MLRVLVIDDSRVVRKMLAHTLETDFPALSVDEYDPVMEGLPGLDFPWAEYRLVFLDYMLGIDGDDGLQWLKKFVKYEGIPPVVMLTDEERTEVVVRAIKLGAADFLLKRDLRTDRLGAVVRQLLGMETMTASGETFHDRSLVSALQAEAEAQALVAIEPRADELVIVRREASVPPVAGHFEVPGYRILSRLAKGGMTTIYLAERIEDELQVVLKLLFTDGDRKKQMLRYFMQEYALISKINHPSIIRIFERAFAKDFAYIAMEYLSAGDLAERIRRGLTADQAVRHLRHIAQGLDAVHDAGIVHRDLKPGNILFRHNDSVAIADFGVAYAAQAVNAVDESEVLIGTPAYMSPEQCEGRQVDPRSDLYSLGVILFEMLTGAKPFVARSVAQIVNAHLRAPVPRLPDHVSRYQPLIDGLLAKDPSERFQTAGELVAGIEWVR